MPSFVAMSARAKSREDEKKNIDELMPFSINHYHGSGALVGSLEVAKVC